MGELTMNRIFLTVFILIIAINSADAQPTFGAKFGLNTSGFYKNSSERINSSYGGLYIDFPMDENFDFTMEINRKTIGGTLNDLSTDTNPDAQSTYIFDLDVDISYLEVPVLVKYKHTMKQDVFFRPYFGISIPMPFLRFHKDNSVERNRHKKSETESVSKYVQPQGESAEGIVAGLVCGASIENERVGIDFRFQSSIGKFDNTKSLSSIDERQFNFMISFIFIFGTQQPKGK